MTHGWLRCRACKNYFANSASDEFFETWGEGETVRLINNPATWGASEDPNICIVGFSKGATQNREMLRVKRGEAVFEEVPFEGMRKRLAALLQALGIMKSGGSLQSLFAPQQSQVRLGALIKCSISVQTQDGRYSYKMKDILAADKASNGLVEKIAETCVRKHMPLRGSQRLFVLLGLDSSYVKLCRRIFERVCGTLSSNSELDYFNERFSWVHIAHPSGNQPDKQFYQWVNGETKKPKVHWARAEVQRRRALQEES